MNAQLTHIHSNGAIEVIAQGELSELTSPECEALIDVTQDDSEWAATNLSRVGARYHEFQGGTLVVTLLD